MIRRLEYPAIITRTLQKTMFRLAPPSGVAATSAQFPKFVRRALRKLPPSPSARRLIAHTFAIPLMGHNENKKRT